MNFEVPLLRATSQASAVRARFRAGPTSPSTSSASPCAMANPTISPAISKRIKDQNGKPVKVDTEGTAKGDSQTKETAKRGGIGAGLGAVIGAVAGGGKGAAIGAIIGGGAGAGSVIAQGRDDIQLLKAR